jgi:hypothetical protein
MKRLLLILLLLPALSFAQNSTDGGKVPLQGIQIGGVGADGQFHFALTDNTGILSVAVVSGGTITEITDPHIVAAPGATPSPSPAKAIVVQGIAGATAVPVSVATIPSHAVTNAGTFAVQSALKQLTGTPSTFTVGTTDATVFTLAAGEIGFIQNLDDAALVVKKGAAASTSSFSFILAAGTAVDNGTGGVVRIDDWVGAVSVAAMTGSPRYIAWKQAP